MYDQLKLNVIKPNEFEDFDVGDEVIDPYERRHMENSLKIIKLSSLNGIHYALCKDKKGNLFLKETKKIFKCEQKFKNNIELYRELYYIINHLKEV